MASIFTKIINREIPAYIVAEDDNHIAFLDVFPLVKGHVLVVPKRELDYIFDLEDEKFTALNLFAKKVATAVKNAMPCVRIGQAVIGLEVPHVHIHLIPIQVMDDMNFSRPKLKLSEEEFKDAQKRIVETYEAL